MNSNSSKLIGVWLTIVAVAGAGDVADGDDDSHTARVLARGKLTMLCFPLLDSAFVRPKLEVIRQRNIPLSELHDAGDKSPLPRRASRDSYGAKTGWGKS